MLDHLLETANVLVLAWLLAWAVQRGIAWRRARREQTGAGSLFARMNHELRAPLTALLGYAEIAREPALPAERRDECLRQVQRRGKELLFLLEDVIDLARSEEGSLGVYPVDLALRTLVDDVAETCRAEADRKGVLLEVRVDPDVPQRIHADPARLRQVMRSLLYSALRFTRRGSVALRVSFLDAHLWVRVRDSGPGEENPMRGRLLAAFRRGDAAALARDGAAGIGLSLAARVVARLGGTLELDRSGGRGCLFTAVLPYAPPVEPWLVPPPSTSAPRPSAPVRRSARFRGRVLLVEDGPDEQMLIRHVLEGLGVTVHVAPGGSIAARCLAEDTFDLVLMDVQMGDADGCELTRQLRARGEQVPIVALTAHALAEDRDRCLASGCDDFLTKPLDRTRLCAVLARHLGAPVTAGTLDPRA